jgi:hypothetical protein
MFARAPCHPAISLRNVTFDKCVLPFHILRISEIILDAISNICLVIVICNDFRALYLWTNGFCLIMIGLVNR